MSSVGRVRRWEFKSGIILDILRLRCLRNVQVEVSSGQQAHKAASGERHG